MSSANRGVANALYFPEQSRSERYLALLLFLLSFSYLCIFRRYATMEPDEGILLQGAQRILSGQVLYRDFFSFYTPGSYYALALLFKIFGSSLLVARTALALTGAVLSPITYLLARRVCSRAAALTLSALATLTTLPYRFLVLHNWDSTLWACLSLYCAVRLLELPSPKWAFGVGVFASLTVLFEQSKGTGLCLGLGAGFLAIWLLQGRKRQNRTELLLLAVAFAVPIVITFAYFALQHAVPTMLADWFWPLQHYSRANRVPYGYQNWTDASRHELFGTGALAARMIKILAVSPCLWIPLLPLLAAGLFAYWMGHAWQKDMLTPAGAYYIIVAATFSGLMLSIIAVRADIIHFMYLQPLNCLLLAWILDAREFPGKLLKRLRPVLAAYVVVALGAFGLAPLLGTASAGERIATRRGVVTTRGKDTVVDYLQAHVPAGKTILVYPYLPLYYYLTATFSPGRFDYFQPGMHTRAQADEIVHDLVAGRVEGVLFEADFSSKVAHSWPGTPLSAIADDPVAGYIARNYHACRALTSPAGWHFVFMVRQDLACP